MFEKCTFHLGHLGFLGLKNKKHYMYYQLHGYGFWLSFWTSNYACKYYKIEWMKTNHLYFGQCLRNQFQNSKGERCWNFNGMLEKHLHRKLELHSLLWEAMKCYRLIISRLAASTIPYRQILTLDHFHQSCSSHALRTKFELQGCQSWQSHWLCRGHHFAVTGDCLINLGAALSSS